MSGVTIFLFAVSGTSLICFLLMKRTETRSPRRRRLASESPDSGGSSDADGWNWFGSHSPTSDSSDSSSRDSSSDGDSSGGDGGGGDGGGGD